MAFDISRFTFNPGNDYLGVVMQQGRVHLDSDWNELVAELTRRIHAGALDVVGLTGVPSTTPLAFQMAVTPPDASGNIHVTIGVGRIYVDGILAENHGAVTLSQSESILIDPAGSAAPTDYTSQPYVKAVTLPPGNAIYLAYLDVWRRDVSYLQDPGLIDQAVGVDTTGRVQTVWQVKLLDVTAYAGSFAGSTPDTAIWNGTTALASGPIWQTLIQGSPSLLTNGTAASGYTGQENQLYRVEIHHGGSAASSATLPVTYSSGMATFKWSRENASVTTAVTAIAPVTNSLNNPASQLTVVSLGRDQVLGFQPGDWVEITDDYLELSGALAAATLGSASSLQSGELHQIDSINAAALTLTLDSPVSATNFPLTGGLTDPTRHTRIRRWDQSGTVYLADGQTAWTNLDAAGNDGIPVPPSGTSLILENGVTVAFDLNATGAGAFQSGDYWSFAARTADGSVATLQRAPPAGIDHHICRLAILDFTASPPVATDCRTVFQSLANPAIHVTNIAPASGVQLLAGQTLSVQDLAKGINIFFDSPIDPGLATSGAAPICTITVQLPATGGGWSNPVTLAGTVSIAAAIPRSITWTPASTVESALLAFVSPTSPPVPARLTLKGNSIWSPGGPPTLYLNGAGFADGRAYADFDMWFWLNSQPPVTLSTPALTFGPQTVGTQSATTPITLTNNSGGPLTLGGITVSGTNVADYNVTNTCGTGIAAGASCTINVIFAPTTVSPFLPTRTASINVAASTSVTGTANPSPPPITLTGTALAPWLLTTPNNLSFPATVVGSTSTLTLTISNAGTAPLSISTITIGAAQTAAPAAATPAAPTGLTVAAAAVAPAISTTKIVEAKVTDIVTKTADKSVEVKAVEKVVETKIVETKSVITDTKITDTKVTDVIVPPPVTTSAPGDFNQSSNCVPPAGGTLQPGQACTVTVSFTPSATGVRSATLVITHNAAGSPTSIALNGTGILQTKLIEVKLSDKVLDTVKTTDIIAAHPSVSAAAQVAATTRAAAPAATGAALNTFVTPQERPAVTAATTAATKPGST